MNTFMHDIEELKKEIWFLKNKTIKNLIEEVALLTGGQLDSTLMGRITTLEENLSTLENSVKTLKADLETNNEATINFGTQVVDLSVLYSLMQQDINLIKVDIEEFKNTDELLSGSVNTANDNISKLNEKVTTVESDISTIFSKINELTDKDSQFDSTISSLKNDVIHLNARMDTNDINMYATGQKIDEYEERITALENSSGSGGSGGSDDSEILEEIENIKSDYTQLKSKVDENSDLLSTHQEKMTSHEGNIEAINGDISSLKSLVEELENEDIDLRADVDLLTNGQVEVEGILKANCDDIQNLQTTSSNHEERIVVLEESDYAQNGNIEEAQTSITKLTQTTNEMSSTLSIVEATATSNSEALATLQNEIEQLKARVDASSSPVVDVIYDMRSEDEAINRGMISGMVGYKTFNVDLSVYSKIKVFVNVFGYEVQKELDLVNRLKTDISIFAGAANPKTFYVFKIVIGSGLNKFQTSAYSKWTWTTATSLLTVDYAASDDNLYVYRVEGTRK